MKKIDKFEEMINFCGQKTILELEKKSGNTVEKF